jgi:hypothetical protein
LPSSTETDPLPKFEDAHPEINLTVRGITIDSNDEPENAPYSIRSNSASHANATDERDQQSAKQPAPITKTLPGMIIDFS